MDDYCSQVCLSILVSNELHIEHLISVVKLFSEYLNFFVLCVIMSRSLLDILYSWFMVLAKKVKSLILLTTLETFAKSQQV